MNKQSKNILTIVFFSVTWCTLVSYVTWIPDITVLSASTWDIGEKILLAVAIFGFDIAMDFLISSKFNVPMPRYVAWFLCMLAVFIAFTSAAITYRISALILALFATGLMGAFKTGLLFLKQKEEEHEKVIYIK